MNAHTMFHLALPKIVEVWRPLAILLQIFRDMLGEQDVSGITAIHYPLRHVYSRASDVRLFIKIADFIHWTAVNAHAHGQVGMTLQCLGSLDRAQDWRFGATSKD